MVDTFSTAVLAGVVRQVKTPPSWLLDRYFTSETRSQTEEIAFDLITRRRRLAPFVSPMVAGKVVASQGYTTNTFKPAYTKDRRPFNPSRALKRAVGETIGGAALSPADRMRLLLVEDLEDQIDMLTRRFEWMATSALTTGSVTVVGELYPAVVVNFGRDGSLTVTLSGTARWGQSAAAILDNLQDWALLVLQKSGSMPTDVIMGVDVWKVFRKDPAIVDKLKQWKDQAASLNTGAMTSPVEGGQFMGQVDGFNIFTYSSWYEDEQGAEHSMWPAGTVVLTGVGVEGVRAFGAIRDDEAGLQAMPYFSKSWVEKDPAIRQLLTQSAPLMVPTNVNASLAAQVL